MAPLVYLPYTEVYLLNQEEFSFLNETQYSNLLEVELFE